MTREEAEKQFLDRIVGTLVGVHWGSGGPFEIVEVTAEDEDEETPPPPGPQPAIRDSDDVGDG